MDSSTLDARQLRHEIYGARKVLNQAYAELAPSLAPTLPACSSRPASGRGVPSSPRKPIVPNPPRKRVVSAATHSSRRVVSATATKSGNTPNRITTFAPPGEDDENSMRPPRTSVALSQSSCGSSDTLGIGFPLESSHHFQRSELARNIAKWQAHALKLKEGSFKSVYRWAHHCIDTAASAMEVPVGGEYVGDDLEQEGEGGTTAAGIEKWKASEEALGRRAGVACTVLDALMSELCADSDLWAKLRPLLFGSIFQEWPSNLAEQHYTTQNTDVTMTSEPDPRVMTASQCRGGLIAAHRSFAGAYFGLKASYEDLTRRAFKQASSLQTVKSLFLTRVLRNRQDALRRAFLGWRGVVADTASRRNKMEATFATRNRRQLLGSRFHTWKVIWIQTHHRRGRERRKSPKLAPTPTTHTSLLDISTEGHMSSSLPLSVGPPATTKSDYVIKQQTGAIATLQGLLAEEKILRSRDFLSFSSEITSLNEQLSTSSRTLTTTRGQKALWRSLWLTFHRDHCLPVPIGDHLASLIPRIKGATEYLLWFAQQRLDAALLLSEVHKIVSSSPDASVHLQSVLTASSSRRPSAVDSQQGEGKQERSRSIRSKRGSNTPNLTPQMSTLLTRAGENVFVSSSRALLTMPAAPQCLVDVRGVWGEDSTVPLEGLKTGVGSMSSQSMGTFQEGSNFPGIPHLESVSSMQSGAVGREDSVRLLQPPTTTSVSHHRAIDEVFERNTTLLREELESVVVAWVNRLLTLREELVEREQGAKPEQRSRLLSSLVDDLADGEIYLSLLDGIERAVVVHQPTYYDPSEPTSQPTPELVDESSGKVGRGPAARAAAARAVVKALHQAVGRGGGPSAGPFPSWCQTPLSACADPTLLAALFDPKRPLSKADNLFHLWVLTTLLCDFSSRLATPEEASEAFLPTDRSRNAQQLTLHLSPSSADSQSTLPPSPAVKLLLLNNRCFSNALPSMQGVSGASVIQAVQRASVIGSDAGLRSQSVTDLKETDNNVSINKSSRSGSDTLSARDATVASQSTTQLTLPPAVDSNFLADPRLTTAQSSSTLSVASQLSTSSPRLHVRRSTAAPTDGTLPGDDVGSRKVPTPRPSFSGWLRQIPAPGTISGELGREGEGQGEGGQEGDAFGSGNPASSATVTVPTISVQGGDGEDEEPLVISTPTSSSIQMDRKHIIDGIDIVDEQDSDLNSLCQSITLDGSGLHSTVMPLQLPQSQRGASPPQPHSSAPATTVPLRPRAQPALPPAVVDVGAGSGYIVQTESDAGPQGEFTRLAEAGPMGNPKEGFVGLRWYRELNDSTAPLNTRDYEPPAVDSDQLKVSVNEGSVCAPSISTIPSYAHPAFVEMPDLASSMDPSVVPPAYDALQWFELTKEARLRRQEWLALGRVVAAAVVGCRCLEEPKVLVDEVRTQSMVNSGDGVGNSRAQSTHLSVSNISKTANVAKRLSAASSNRRRSDNTSTSNRVQTTSLSPQPMHPSPKQSRKVSAASTTSSSAPSRSGRDSPPHTLAMHGDRQRSLDPTINTPTPRAGTIVGLPSAPSPNGDLHAPSPTSRKGSNNQPSIPTTIQPAAFQDVITGASFRKPNNL